LSSETLIREIQEWFQHQSDVGGILLVGSHARGDARRNSDIDLLILVQNISSWINHTDWARKFGEPKEIEVEDWGQVQSVRVFYDNQEEVEFSFALSSWTNTSPIDEGTRSVIKGGAMVLFDPNRLFQTLINSIK
jgi:predicted nucleotidyltransferase